MAYTADMDISWYSRTDGLSICHDCIYRAPSGVFSTSCYAGKHWGTSMPTCCDLYRHKPSNRKGYAMTAAVKGEV